ncbi:MAG: DUF167 domain-containing protein [Candidatus Omnitrophota bacterium]
MIIQVRVSPRASRALVQETGAGYKVYCTKPAADGQANAQVIELVAAFFKVKKYNVRIVRGNASRTKSLEIIDE